MVLIYMGREDFKIYMSKLLEHSAALGAVSEIDEIVRNIARIPPLDERREERVFREVCRSID